MTFLIVPAPSRTVSRRAIRRALRVLAGLVLVLVSLVAMVPLALVATATAVFTIAGDPPDLGELSGGDAAVLGGGAVAGLFAWWAGTRLIRGRRRLGLYLRRFGFAASTTVVSQALVSGVGRDWRLVTLDDHEVAPLGVARRGHRAVRLGRLLGLVVVAAGVFGVVSWLSGGGVDRVVGQIFGDAQANAEAEGQNPFAAIFGAAIVTLVVGTVVLGLLMVLVLVPLGLAGLATLRVSIGARAAKRAERSKALVIDRADDVDRSVRRLRALTRRFFAPRLTVVRVATPLWQDVVRRFTAVADAVVVDVSQPSGNLLWEIELLETTGAVWVPIGEADRLRALLADGSEEAVELRRHLSGREVLGYAAGEERFAPGLRSSLELAVAG